MHEGPEEAPDDTLLPRLVAQHGLESAIFHWQEFIQHRIDADPAVVHEVTLNNRDAFNLAIIFRVLKGVFEQKNYTLNIVKPAAHRTEEERAQEPSTIPTHDGVENMVMTIEIAPKK